MLFQHLGGIIIDHSTVSPELSMKCHTAASSKVNCAFLDAPISGGPEGADNGTLSIMVGGDENAYEESKNVLQCMGSHSK